MSTSAHATGGNGIDVVVSSDGSLNVTAEELARHGVGPGARLRLVVSEPAVSKRRGGGSAGRLARTVPPDVVRDLIKGLDEAKAERRAFYSASS